MDSGRVRQNCRVIDVQALWDFDDPAQSERRFREAAAAASGVDAAVLMTQVARALGLQERFDEGHAVLDGVGGSGSGAGSDEVRVRVELERGRLLRSAGDPAGAEPYFGAAVASAAAAGLDGLHVDALHMLALVKATSEQVAVHERALALARSSADPDARRWVPSLLNNLGMTYSDLGDWSAALTTFREALTEREQRDDAGATRIAKWMVGWALRNLGRADEALAVQRALRAELDAVGETDPYVDEELELLEG